MSRQQDAVLLAQGAAALRALVPQFRDSTLSEFLPVAVGVVLDRISGALATQEEVPEAVVRSALELAHHLVGHVPTDREDPPPQGVRRAAHRLGSSSTPPATD